jgi:TolB-like protein
MGTANRPHTPNQRLSSWKEIATFFDCDERTLRRWEKRGLPIHRTPGGAGGKVFAYTDELSAWLAAPRNSGASLRQPAVVLQPRPEASGVRLSIVSGQPHAKGPAPVASLARHRWKITALALLATFAVAVLGLALFYRSPGPDSIAVLPFANGGGDASTDYLSDGITESLIDNLTHIPRLKVRSRSSVFHYKGKEVDVRKVGNDLGVSVLVTGRVVPQGDSIEVTAELTDVRENTEIWGQHYTGKSADIISMQQRIAGDIAEKLRSKLSPSEKQQVTRQSTQDPEAYELYLKGRYSWNKRTSTDLAAAISYFNQALAKDPGYALAYSGLADAYSVLPNFGGTPSEDYPRSNAAARRALELDATLAHPHAVLGSNEMQYDWDFAGGEAEFKRAFELDPNDATARQWYADDIGMIGGREREAIAEVNRAHQLDPLAPVISRVVASVLVSTRRFDEAIVVCKKLGNEDPTFAVTHDCLAYAYWGKRMYPQVIEEWKAYGQLTGDPKDSEYAEALEQGFRAGGWKGALTKAIETREAWRKTGYASPLFIARLYADRGDKDQAFHWLNVAYQDHDWLLIGLNTYFQLDSLRSDPRFAELVRKVGLPH